MNGTTRNTNTFECTKPFVGILCTACAPGYRLRGNWKLILTMLQESPGGNFGRVTQLWGNDLLCYIYFLKNIFR
eukprot:SAG31_NODE_3067_length_4723_cov_8.835063_5_plen_74_part_00